MWEKSVVIGTQGDCEHQCTQTGLDTNLWRLWPSLPRMSYFANICCQNIVVNE